MVFHFNSFSILLLISGMTALLIAIVLFQRLQQQSIFWFALMMVAVALWAIFYSFELSSSSMNEMLFWIHFEYIGIGSIPALWIMFVVHYVGKQDWLNKRNIIAIFFFPIIVLLLVWTNRWHHIHYTSTALVTTGPFPILSITPGPWYHIHTAYFYFMLAFGMVLLFRYHSKSEPLYRSQTRAILIGGLIPWVTNLFYLLGFRPFSHLDLTPYTFIFTALIIAYGLTRYELFRVIPFAREKLVESIREGIVVLDSRQRIVDINTTFRSFLQGNSNRIIGERLNIVMPTQYKMHQLIDRQINGEVEIALDSSTGEKTFEVSVTVLYDEKMKRAGTLLIFWDATHLKKTSDQLLELNELKNMMFSIIAHDLRSPLNSLMGLLHGVQSEILTEAELKEIIGKLAKDVDSTSALLDNLLNWAGSHQKGQHIYPELINLKEVAAYEIRFFDKRATEKGIFLVDEIENNTILYADKNMVRMIIRNLLSNAVKFCDEGDVITLRQKIEKEFTIVQIIDTGLGMDEAIKKRLFTINRSAQFGTRKEKGTGLGLMLCKDFIEKSGGAIWVESEPGEGSTFSFQLRNKA